MTIRAALRPIRKRAQFGYSMSWVSSSLPEVCAIQEISACIGRATGRGIAGNLKKHYPSSIVYGVASLLVIANVNIGAILARWVLPQTADRGPALVWRRLVRARHGAARGLFALARYVSILKWLTLSLWPMSASRWWYKSRGRSRL